MRCPIGFLVSFVVAMTFLSSQISCENYAILIAAVYEYDHFAYTAESDIYQAYYQLIENGVPADNIIVFCMDSVAYHPKNPFPGEVYNYEGGPNVYPRIKNHMDYVYENNTKENLLKVLMGEDMHGIGSGRTLKATENDNVMVYSWQHGDVGYLCFYYEEMRRDILFAVDLLATIREMQATKKKFKNFAWFMLSCYAGSLFNKEFDDPTENVYFMTSATPERHGLACDYSSKVGWWLNGCMHKRNQEFIRAHAHRLHHIPLHDMYVYNYQYKLEEPELVEVICEYGNKQKFRNMSIATFFGGKNNLSKFEKSRNLDVSLSPTKISIKNPFPVENEMMNIEKSVGEYPDTNFGLCEVYKKMNQSCIKALVPSLIELDPTEGCIHSHYDYIRLKCSNPETRIEDMYIALKPYCTKQNL